MTAVLPSVRWVPAARRTGRLGARQVAIGCAALALLTALGGCGRARDISSVAVTLHKEDVAAEHYADQLTQIHLPVTYDVIARNHGGTYVAAGNGPYASVAYRTLQSPTSAVALVQQAMEQAGYAVELAPMNSDDEGVTRLVGTAPGRDLEARIGTGVVYDLPFGYIAAVPGTTGVLLVVEDHGRNRD